MTRINAFTETAGRKRLAAVLTRRADGSWHCALPNGIAATLSYAGVLKDEAVAGPMLARCETTAQAVALLGRIGLRNFRYVEG